MELKQSDAVHESDHESGGGPKDFFYNEVPGQHVGEFVGEHPKVMSARVDNTPAAYEADSSAVRRKLSLRERRRLLETAFYRNCGFPRWRNTRYKLLGKYLSKDRGDY